MFTFILCLEMCVALRAEYVQEIMAVVSKLNISKQLVDIVVIIRIIRL